MLDRRLFGRAGSEGTVAGTVETTDETMVVANWAPHGLPVPVGVENDSIQVAGS